MKKYLTLITVVLLAVQATAQSKSYQTFKDTFKDGDDVHSFSVSGFLARTVLWMADEHEFADAITDIKNIKLVVVPKGEFSSRRVSLSGFKEILKTDSFQELAHFRDQGDLVTIYLQEHGKTKLKDRYFILVEDTNEVVAIELKGSVDMNRLINMEKEVAAK
jgi:uncharacterized protein DUF4252